MWESLGWVFPLQSLNLTLPQALNGKGQASGLTESRPAAETYWNMLRSEGACGRWGKSTCSYRVYSHICVGTAGVWIHTQSHLQGAVRKWRKVNWRRKHPDVEWGWPTLDASCGGRYKGCDSPLLWPSLKRWCRCGANWIILHCWRECKYRHNHSGKLCGS